VSADLRAGGADGLVALLRAHAPESVADPDKAQLETIYLDHELMVTRCAGARHRGTLDVWRRDGGLRLARPAQ
jgi:hypothetical protein